MPCQSLSSAPRLTADSRARLVMTVRICPLVATPPWRSNNSSRPSAMTAIVGSDPGGRYRVDAVLWRKHRLGTVPLAERPRNAGNGGVSQCRHLRKWFLSRGWGALPGPRLYVVIKRVWYPTEVPQVL